MSVLSRLKAAREHVATSATPLLAVADIAGYDTLLGMLAYRAVVVHCSPWSLIGFAERHTKAELIAVFDQAIAAVEVGT